MDMKVRRLKKSDAVDQTLWKLGCRNRQQTGLQSNGDWSTMKKKITV